MTRRKMLAADEDLANRVAEIASQKGLTVFQTVNSILENALKAEDAGLNLKDVIEKSDIVKRAQEMGLTFTVEHLYYQIVDNAYSSDREKVKELWREMGHWYGKYFQNKNPDPIKGLTEALGYLTYGGEFSVTSDKNESIIISCISEHYTRRYTELFTVFLEAAFEVLGYKTVEMEKSRGIIKLRAEKSRS